MSSESIERFDLVYDRAFDGTMENPHIGPWVTGSFIRLSDHERIVKKQEAWVSDKIEQAVYRALTYSDDIIDDRPVPFADLSMRDRAIAAIRAECVVFIAQPSLSDAIKEVERMRDEITVTNWAWGTEVGTLNKAIKRLKSLGPQKGD